MARALRFDHETSRWALPAGLISALAHGGLLWVIAASTQWLPAEKPLSPLRFVGQTFDVDALGEDNEEEARPPARDSDSKARTAPKTSAVKSDAQSTDAPTSSAEPARELPERELPSAEVPASRPEPSDKVEKEVQPNRIEPAPAQSSTKTIDPFDLAVPGDASPSSARSTAGQTGSYGAEGSEAPVTDVFKAFLHLFPEANRHNPAFHDLPLGPIGRLEFSLVIGKDARLVSIEIHDEAKTPPPTLLISAVQKTQTYLVHQRLGWEGERREGRQRLSLSMVAKQKEPHPTSPEREGTYRHGRYGEARPNAAFFTYYDGRHVDIELERVP